MPAISTIMALGLIALCMAMLMLLAKFKFMAALLLAMGAALIATAKDIPLVIVGLIVAVIGASVHLQDAKNREAGTFKASGPGRK